VGLFDWFKSSPTNVECPPHAIWVSQAAKLKGIRQEIAEALARRTPPAAIFVVAHFSKPLRELQDMTAGISASVPLRTCLAAEIGSALRAFPAPVAGQGIDVIASENHPLPVHDEALLKSLEELSYPCRLTYHISLEDAVLRVFGGQRTIDLLRGMGMKDDEAIRSRMVTRRIRDAQRKVAESSWGDLPADSAEKWLELNSPQSFNRMS
jgi:hypothetical protein